MRFWDSSAIISLVAGEGSSAALEESLRADGEMVAWWATSVECASALARKGRREEESGAAVDLARRRLSVLAAEWTEIAPTDRLRALALRLVRVHDLRAADGLQLAAAAVASDEQPEGLELVTRDERLANAAALEGFPVLGR